MALARHAFAESFLTVRSSSHRCEFRFTRFLLRATISLVPLYTSRTFHPPLVNADEWWRTLEARQCVKVRRTSLSSD
jgi:hypothetical protein